MPHGTAKQESFKKKKQFLLYSLNYVLSVVEYSGHRLATSAMSSP